MITYYGRTPAGKKIHKGTHVVPYLDTQGRTFRVITVCSREMLSRDTDLDWDDHFEFCKQCFRATAWELFMKYGREFIARELNANAG